MTTIIINIIGIVFGLIGCAVSLRSLIVLNKKYEEMKIRFADLHTRRTDLKEKMIADQEKTQRNFIILFVFALVCTAINSLLLLNNLNAL